MTEVRSQPQPGQVYATTTPGYEGGAASRHRYKGGGLMSLFPEISPSGSQLLVLLAGVPLGGMLLLLAGMSLIASLVGLAVATPLFILFSPVLVPAVAALGLAVAGVLAAGACGLVGLVSFSWVVNYLRMCGMMPLQLGAAAKLRVEYTSGYLGQNTKEAAQDIQTRPQEPKGV